MTYLVICKDVSDGAKIREEHLHEHLKYIETILDKIEVAGPLNTEQDAEYTSSAFIYRVDSETDVLKLLQTDPYYKAGLYASTDIKRFQAVVGNWIGGKTW